MCTKNFDKDHNYIMTDIFKSSISKIVKGHILDDVKAKNFIEEINKLIEKTLSIEDFELVYQIEPEVNCDENCADQYRECIRMSRKEKLMIDKLFKTHKFLKVEDDCLSGGHGCIITHDFKKMWNEKSKGVYINILYELKIQI